MSMDKHADLKLNEKWCRNFMRVLLARRVASNSTTYKLPETGEEYQIIPVEGEEPGWKIEGFMPNMPEFYAKRATDPDADKLPDIIQQAERNGVFWITAGNDAYRMGIRARNVDADAFVHVLFATLGIPSDEVLRVSTTADAKASQTKRWALEHKKVNATESRVWMMTDTQGYMLIKTTATVKKAKDALYKSGPAVGTQGYKATFVSKTAMETRTNPQTQRETRTQHGGSKRDRN